MWRLKYTIKAQSKQSTMSPHHAKDHDTSASTSNVSEENREARETGDGDGPRRKDFELAVVEGNAELAVLDHNDFDVAMNDLIL